MRTWTESFLYHRMRRQINYKEDPIFCKPHIILKSVEIPLLFTGLNPLTEANKLFSKLVWLLLI